MRIFGMKSGNIAPIQTESAFIKFIASEANKNSKILFILELSRVTKKKVLSPISARKIIRKD